MRACGACGPLIAYGAGNAGLTLRATELICMKRGELIGEVGPKDLIPNKLSGDGLRGRADPRLSLRARWTLNAHRAS